METLSLAECLAELKRIDSLLHRRFNNISRYCSKMKNSKDEVEKQKEYVKSQAQSAEDLLTRYKTIKLKIAEANLRATFEYDGKEYSIAEAILYKHYLHRQYVDLYQSFNTGNAQRQINERLRYVGSGLTKEDLEKLDLIPETYYDEKQIQKKMDDLITFMTYIDKLIDKTNHSTFVEI